MLCVLRRLATLCVIAAASAVPLTAYDLEFLFSPSKGGPSVLARALLHLTSSGHGPSHCDPASARTAAIKYAMRKQIAAATQPDPYKAASDRIAAAEAEAEAEACTLFADDEDLGVEGELAPASRATRALAALPID